MKGAGRLNLDFDPRHVTNLERLRDSQLQKLNDLRSRVRELRFVPIDSAGSYVSTSFKSFDGGLLNLDFDPFEFEIIRVADSNGNTKMNFAAPIGDYDADELRAIFEVIDTDPIMQDFLSIVGKDSLRDVTELPTARETLMEIAEFACMFSAVAAAPDDGKTMILRDGLLRTKKIKSELITRLKQTLARKKGHVRVAGVAKKSRIIFLLKAALVCERVFPKGQIGYVKIPLDLENMAYKWGGGKRLGPGSAVPLEYAFGSLYIAKLSRRKDLLVTVEMPDSSADNAAIYSDEDITEMMGYLARDSAHSYPVLGYPQTLMRAHEHAAGMGLPASILRDRIIKELVNDMDPMLSDYIRDSSMLDATVDKGTLGGRA